MRHLEPDGEQSFRIAVALITVAIVAVALRVLAKIKARARLKLSDWLIFATLAVFLSMIGTYLNGLFDAGGQLDIHKMNLRQLNIMYKYIFIAEMLFTVNIVLLKFSIIVFYYDLFSSCRQFRVTMIVISVVQIIWFLTCFLVNSFQCSPVEGAWNPLLVISGKAKCINYSKFIVGYEATNMILDVAILVSCVWVVRTLQLSVVQRWFVSGIILLGGFVCVVCVLRIYYFTAFSFTFGIQSKANLNLLLSWSAGQLTMGILCACIPCYCPLLPTQKMVRSLDRWYRAHKRGGDDNSIEGRSPTPGTATTAGAGPGVGAKAPLSSSWMVQDSGNRPGGEGSPKRFNSYSVVTAGSGDSKASRKGKAGKRASAASRPKYKRHWTDGDEEELDEKEDGDRDQEQEEIRIWMERSYAVSSERISSTDFV